MNIRKISILLLSLVFIMGCTPAGEIKNIATATESKPESPVSQPEPKTVPATPVSPIMTHYLFGVLNDAGLHYDDEWDRGVRATNLELHWDKYEPSEGVYDLQYINEKRQEMAYLKSNGWFVQLVPGYHYVPAWVFTSHPEFYLVNQYGEIYNPDPLQDDRPVINAMFNPQARSLIVNYLEHMLTESFPQDDMEYKFDSIRVGGGPQGELRYPTRIWKEHTNSYWAYDTSAQTPAISGIPEAVIGWRPGIDPNPGTVGRGQLIVNPGFEDSNDYYPVFGWSPDDEVTAWFDNNAPHSGNASLTIIIDTPHRVHQFVSVEPGASYVVNGWLRSADGLGHARLFLTQYDLNSQLIQEAPYAKLESGSTAWEFSEATLQTTTATQFIKVEVDGDRAGTYSFDDLKLSTVGESDERSREINIPTTFYDWYVEKLTDYQNWQISEIKKYYDGQLDILYAGKGIQSKQIMGALTNDLTGDGWSEDLSALYAGTDFQRHVNGLSTDERIALYVTGIDVESPEEVNDDSPSPGDWSAAHWLAHLAREQNLPVWGENSGQDSSEKLWLSARRMHENLFIGMMWGFEIELYANPNPNEYATISDYERVIQFYNNLQVYFIPIIAKR